MARSCRETQIVCGNSCYFILKVSISGKRAWLLHLPWKEASNTQLQSWPFQNVTVQTGKQHTMNSFIVVGVFYCSGIEGASSSFIIGSSGLWKHDYDLGLHGTSLNGICYFMAEQY